MIALSRVLDPRVGNYYGLSNLDIGLYHPLHLVSSLKDSLGISGVW